MNQLTKENKILWKQLSEHYQKLIINKNKTCCGYFDKLIERLNTLENHKYLTTKEMATVCFLVEREFSHPKYIFFTC